MPVPQPSTKNRLIVCSLLVIATVTAYWQIKGLQFINYDDPTYVTGNPHVQMGLSLNGILWAFKSTEASNWHPLTWLSHMLDYQLYGPDPAGHHLTSLFIHIANVLLLFWALQLFTGALWRSAIVAALFAVHPLNVESVAWIAERKNVLSTLFCLLTILAYARYATHPKWKRYLLVMALLACGLMSKPMLVTLPFTLLLLDYWPLGRLKTLAAADDHAAPVTSERRKLNKHKDDKPQIPEQKYAAASLRTLVLEKVPLLGMAAISSAVTIVAQGKGGAVGSTVTFTTWGRISNAIVSYAMYLQKMIWPSGLAVFYPYTRGSLPPGRIALSALILVAITALALVAVRSRFRFVTIGWLWYLGTLVPVIGLIQVGLQSRADRYAYVPLIGIFVLIVWGISEAAKRAGAEKVFACAAIGAAIALSVVTWRQLAYWHDSITLFQEAAAVTQGNYIAYTNLGQALAGEGKTGEAAKDFAIAIQDNPNFDEAQHNMGMALVQQGKLDEAIDHFKKAIQINPRMTDAYNKLGATLARQERYDEAAPYLYKAIELNPDYPAAYANLGALQERQGKLEEALDFDFKALRLIAEHPMTLRTGEGNIMAVQVDCRTGGLLAKKGNLSDAMRYYKEALRLKPDYPPATEGLNAIMDIFDRRSNPDAGQQQ